MRAPACCCISAFLHSLWGVVSYDPGTQSGKKEETLRISDMLGRTVYQRTLSEAGTLEIDVQEWSAGIYFIFVEGRGLSRQIVIIR